MIKNLSKEESKEFYEFNQLLLSDDEQDELKVNTTLNFGILDRYPEKLSESESLDLLSNKYLDNNDRPKFIKFFSELLSHHECIINCSNLFGSRFNLTHIKERVTKTEYKNLLILKKSIKSRFIMTHDLMLLKVILNFTLKEIIFFDFYLPHEKTVILGNYDFSLPVYSKKPKFIEKLKKMAEERGLFIRDIEYKDSDNLGMTHSLR
ncbi:hypothetical protein J2Z69_002295 [Paenibacillus shirakamiensis]|uniref:Uncharacterized protein n=1 Tax=Paenibacillus shirakamiensis TaxID=1265935 RepID=A0ABS4JHQ0_9BACL|nr:hypothetical protein [Paenibacillus shirakamiensis]MBP2001252.1 hypothetical protein [Paenibacillus shirakamiensis]